MNTRSSLSWLVLASLAVIPACDDSDPPAELPAELAAELQASLDQTVADGVAPGVALFVSHPERGTFAGAAGLGDLDGAGAMLPGGHLRAGSMLKPLVATAVLQ